MNCSLMSNGDAGFHRFSQRVNFCLYWWDIQCENQMYVIENRSIEKPTSDGKCNSKKLQGWFYRVSLRLQLFWYEYSLWCNDSHLDQLQGPHAWIHCYLQRNMMTSEKERMNSNLKGTYTRNTVTKWCFEIYKVTFFWRSKNVAFQRLKNESHLFKQKKPIYAW